MKRVATKIILLVMLTVTIIFSFNNVLAVPENKEIISNDTKSQLVNITNKEKKSIEDYYDLYGSKTYGTVAFVLNKVRVYSIPLCFLGIAISAIYEYILGIRHMETRDKGFNMMITIITIFVICQVLPLVFAIITTSVISKYQQKYKEIVTSKNVYYFNAIIKELQNDRSYDAIVIGEDLEPISNNNYDVIDKFIIEKLDVISDEASKSSGEDIPIIFICSDRRTKSDQLLRNLFSMGIYNALVGNDRSLDKVCSLINKPRNKKEAKKYYMIDGDDSIEYEPASEELVSEEQLRNILTYYKKIGNDEKTSIWKYCKSV